jgi:hypothetical protein
MTADVFLLTFFFPSGFKVERHVLQGASLFGAVRQDTLGKLPDVPVPKKMNSMPGAGRTESGESPDSDIIELRELCAWCRETRWCGVCSSSAFEGP